MNRRFDDAGVETNRRFDGLGRDIGALRERMARVEEAGGAGAETRSRSRGLRAGRSCRPARRRWRASRGAGCRRWRGGPRACWVAALSCSAAKPHAGYYLGPVGRGGGAGYCTWVHIRSGKPLPGAPASTGDPVPGGRLGHDDLAGHRLRGRRGHRRRHRGDLRRPGSGRSPSARQTAAPTCPASGHPSRARDVVLCIEAGGITVEATASPELLSELDRHAPAPDGRRG